ncbi:MAG TPA: PTS sugar transporter subunit IIA [Candidatus Binatia bacterium]|jgi:two-component system sensor histidine kinase KdpD
MSRERSDHFLELIRRAHRGRLKVYLGYGPGVGKTWQMLEEAHRLRQQAVDVVVGYVETHGRDDVARLAAGLETLARRKEDYRGLVLEEFDVEAALARKPEVVLVDELAHANLPGSRNAKRYEDVQELLAAGIHVLTTLNVQHLESLYDTVERLVGIKVRERLPDSVLADADEVVNVDLSPQDLRRRVADGKVYPRGGSDGETAGLFAETSLERLRELTMREIASQIDFRRRAIPRAGEGSSPDQIMVCLGTGAAANASLLRFASRLAGRLNRNWYAVHVQGSVDAGEAAARALADTMVLANELGATVFTFRGDSVVDTIVRFAGEYRVGQIVVGRSRQLAWWQHRLGRTTLCSDLIERSAGFTVVVVDTDRDEPVAIEGDTAPTRSTAESSRRLSQLLGENHIEIFDRPMATEQVLRTLLSRIGAGRAQWNADEALARLHERESQGSTFLNEGIALPHARLDGLAAPVAALAVTRAGVSDVAREHPIEVVFLLLAPATQAHEHLQWIGTAVRVFRNASVRRRLAAAAGPGDVLRALEDGEPFT